MPSAREALDRLRVDVMREQAPDQNVQTPEQAKFASAKEQNVPLKNGYNGDLTARQAGAVGGPIGGSMVRRMIELAEQQLVEQQRPRP